jgi:hypothetical protein
MIETKKNGKQQRVCFPFFYHLSARRPPLLKWGMNCVPFALFTNKGNYAILKSVDTMCSDRRD